MSKLFSIDFIKPTQTKVSRVGNAHGDSVVVTADGAAGRSVDCEYYGTHGIVSQPSSITRGVRVRIGSLSICIGSYDYGIAPPANQGETKLYSTDEDGTEQASVLLDNTGKVTINSGETETARKGDTVKLTMSAADIVTLATALIATGAFTPTGTTPVATTNIEFTGGEITSGSEEVLLP